MWACEEDDGGRGQKYLLERSIAFCFGKSENLRMSDGEDARKKELL